MIRHKVYYSLTFCVILLNAGISASVVKEALEEHLKDAAHNEGAESIKHEKAKGDKVHQIESTLNDSHKNQYSKANDEGKYVNKEHDLKSNSETDNYDGHNSKQDKAEDSTTNGFKRGHKKGHHKQGFQNSYHKDESQNKSTFFDDFNDEGDQAAYKSRLNSYDNAGARKYQGSNRKGQEHLRDNYQGGGYNRYGDHGVKHAGHQDYGKNYYLDDNLHHDKLYDDRNIYDRNKIHDRRQYHVPPPPLPPPVYRPLPPPEESGWDWSKWENTRRGGGWEQPGWDRSGGWDRDGGWEGDYGGPGYYDDRGFRHDGGYGYGPNHGYGYGYESRTAPVAQVPKNAPVVAHRKQTITIYEDPRYDGKDKGKLRREEGDYLELEYKPSRQRYAEYDDTYYKSNPSNREAGGVQASKINKLVYNYRRQ
ncbi:hypothetical protein O0L34_g8720 [Tuta absoluta]|nr:hypothetical protein O0L34_g8720 [Tuta absoluta]